ncbi:uncharacterized protein LOC108732836 [Agrilus planipennis]|uniref:Uncharacterized protein LOC108732836 n=1 Tax=Agrilus planipennis TaxID=224129 RepID=A0A7F5R8W8_AGRPL|nr:uncharacterized protein LOC108732836 [Agrilus planipennis]
MKYIEFKDKQANQQQQENELLNPMRSIEDSDNNHDDKIFVDDEEEDIVVGGESQMFPNDMGYYNNNSEYRKSGHRTRSTPLMKQFQNDWNDTLNSITFQFSYRTGGTSSMNHFKDCQEEIS